MNKSSLLFSVTTFIFINSFVSFGQDFNALTDEGNRLYEAKNYQAAIEKFDAALKLDSGNSAFRYKLAFSLNAAGREKEALPHLQKVAEATPSAALKSNCYSLSGTIYDKLKLAGKAIEAYRKAIAIDSSDYSLYYSIGLAYFRDKQFVKAEESAERSLERNPAHAASVRLYALVTFHQDKRAHAFLALCNFLRMEPKGAFAGETRNNLQSILKGGELHSEPGVKAQRPNLQTLFLNKTLTAAVFKAQSNAGTDKAKLFQEQLKAVFQSVGKVAESQSNGPYFQRLAMIFSAISSENQVPAFVNLITQKSDARAAAWVASHADDVEQLNLRFK